MSWGEDFGLRSSTQAVSRRNTVFCPQYEEMRVTAGQHCDNLRSTRDEINELTRLIQRLKTEIEHTKAQVRMKRRKSSGGDAGPPRRGGPQERQDPWL